MLLTYSSSLVETEPSSAYGQFASEYGIKRAYIDIAPNKDGQVRTTQDSLCEAILFALNPNHYPLYIHCNQGRHRTGCVVACLRKIQKWPLDEILREYSAYAHPKARTGDMNLIKSFDPDSVHAYAKSHNLLRFWRRINQPDSAADVYALAVGLPVHKMADWSDAKSSGSDRQLQRVQSSINLPLIGQSSSSMANRDDSAPARDTDVSVEAGGVALANADGSPKQPSSDEDKIEQVDGAVDTVAAHPLVGTARMVLSTSVRVSP